MTTKIKPSTSFWQYFVLLLTMIIPQACPPTRAVGLHCSQHELESMVVADQRVYHQRVDLVAFYHSINICVFRNQAFGWILLQGNWWVPQVVSYWNAPELFLSRSVHLNHSFDLRSLVTFTSVLTISPAQCSFLSTGEKKTLLVISMMAAFLIASCSLSKSLEV